MSEWPTEIRAGTSKIGVIFVHDITGLDPVNLAFAEELHQEGFWVALVDLFRGHKAKDLAEGLALRQKLTSDDLTGMMRAAHEKLRAQMGPGAIIGSLGFCMGGGAALHGACHSDFAFCVDYYGMIGNADDVKNLRGPVLLILASEDDRINPWAYGQLLPKMDEHRKRLQVELYPAVVHPFHRPDWIESPWGGAKAYDKPSADDAWARSLAFIRKTAALHGQ